MSLYTILLVEDDYALAMGTEYSLKSEGYKVLIARNVAMAKEYLKEDINMILLDVMLPDGNGYELLDYIREKNSSVPVIFLTAVGEEANIVRGLDCGADDYITKPYRVKELLSRIAALKRRSGNKDKTSGKIIAFGTTIIDLDNYRITRDGKIVECTLSEFKLLKSLIENQGRVLTRNEIIEKLWDVDEAFVDDNTLSVYIKRLRDKLGEDASFIRTVRGVGYSFEM